MIFPQSSEEQPLHFFIEVFLKGGYDDIKKSFFNKWSQTKEEVDKNIYISIKEEYIIHYFNNNERNEPSPTKIKFFQALEELVEIQCENSKKLIKQGIGTLLLKSKSITPYLVEQTQVLKTLSKSNHPQLPKHIVTGLNAFTRNIIVSDIIGSEYVNRFNNSDFFENKLLKVLEVLGYLNGSGVNQQKIMSDSDYKRLIFYTIQMVQMESVPEIDNPFDKIQVTNELLRYSYYVLHKELFGVQPRKTFFTSFLNSTFLQMQGIDSLAAKFAQKPRNIPDYASEIIKEHWNRK